MLEICPMTLREANAFVEQHHRHHKPVPGCKFTIGCTDGDKIVGVAIVGRPVSRHLDALRQHKGTVILSGYPSEMYDRELKGWSRIAKKSYNQNSDLRTEVLWCNFEVPSLFAREGELL